MKPNLVESVALAIVMALLGTSSSVRATNLFNFAPGMAGVTGYYPSPGNAQYDAGAEGFTPSVKGNWSGFLDPFGDGNLYFANNTRFTLTADPGKTVTLLGFNCGQYSGTGLSSFTILDRNGVQLATVSGVTKGSMAGFGWPVLKDTQLTIVFGSTQEDYTWINSIRFSEQSVSSASITEFGPGATVGGLAGNAAAIAWTVPFGTNVTTLAPTFALSSGTCDKTSGSSYDFTNPVAYVVTDGPTINTYTVTVSVTPASAGKDILAFGPFANISGTDISWTVPFGTDVTALAPTFTVSTFASGSPVSNTTRNFTNPQVYRITAQDGTTRDYTVTVSVAPDETTIFWDLAGGGAWNLGSPNWEGQSSGLPTTFSNGDNVIFDQSSGGTISIAAGMLPLSTTVSAPSGTYTFSGQPVGSGPLAKSGGGTLNFVGSPAGFSSIAVNGGTLFLDAADGFAPGSAPVTMPSVTVESGATLVGYRLHAQGGTLTMNGGRYFDYNGFSGLWAGPIHLTANSFFGSNSPAYAQQLTGVVSGPGGFTFSSTTDAFLGLFNANTYQGPTVVASGKLACINSASLGNTSALNVSTGAKVLLGYTGNQIVASLILGGVTMPPGTYGSSSSTAPPANQLNTFFMTVGRVYFEDRFGTGTVTVAGSPYATWSGGAAADTDTNGDGVQNGVAWVVGATSPNVDASGKVPTLDNTSDPDFLIFNYRRSDIAAADANTAIQAQYGSDLANWTNTIAGPDIVITSINDDYGAGIDRVEVKLRRTLAIGGKLFTRIRVTVTP